MEIFIFQSIVRIDIFLHSTDLTDSLIGSEFCICTVFFESLTHISLNELEIVSDLLLSVHIGFLFQFRTSFEVHFGRFCTTKIQESEAAEIVDTWILRTAIDAIREFFVGSSVILRIIVVNSLAERLINRETVAGLRKRRKCREERHQHGQTKNYFPIHIGTLLKNCETRILLYFTLLILGSRRAGHLGKMPAETRPGLPV